MTDDDPLIIKSKNHVDTAAGEFHHNYFETRLNLFRYIRSGKQT
jgi:hypothetical protein